MTGHPFFGLTRLRELAEKLTPGDLSGSYFDSFDSSIAENSLKKHYLLAIEAELGGLDDCAWLHLKNEAQPLVKRRDRKRGWQQLFDRLNEARAYNFLRRIGCREVRFIPRSSVDNEQTPDLEAEQDAKRVLCEVKSVNVSKEEAERRQAPISIHSTDLALPAGFFSKLDNTLDEAIVQLCAFDPTNEALKIVFVICRFDDPLHEHVDRYDLQITDHLRKNPRIGIKIEFYRDPPFTATRA